MAHICACRVLMLSQVCAEGARRRVGADLPRATRQTQTHARMHTKTPAARGSSPVPEVPTKTSGPTATDALVH